MSSRAGAIAFAFVAAFGGATACTGAKAPGDEAISQGAFSSLRWLEGRWLGSGGGYSAFYEEYRFLNDSTIEQRTFPDSTFATADGVSTIEWRGGVVRSVKQGNAGSRLARISGDTARFEAMTAGRMGYTWIRVSADAWTAILDGNTAPTIYAMRRVSQ